MGLPTPELPAWSLDRPNEHAEILSAALPQPLTRDWAWGGSSGAGVRVCVLDSGVEAEHPFVGAVERAVVVAIGEDGATSVEEDLAGDVCGHGTACAGIIRQLAPECRLFSVRVLGREAVGGGAELLAGLRFAIDEGYDVVNMSLSTTRRAFMAALHELADRAYFRRCVLVACAHNSPVESFPWRFSSVVSVASHTGNDSLDLIYNSAPPVEFFARGVDVEVGWLGNTTIRASGNSFAAPHVSAMCARILAKHPALTPFQLKTVLFHIASNVEGGRHES